MHRQEETATIDTYNPSLQYFVFEIVKRNILPETFLSGLRDSIRIRANREIPRFRWRVTLFCPKWLQPTVQTTSAETLSTIEFVIYFATEQQAQPIGPRDVLQSVRFSIMQQIDLGVFGADQFLKCNPSNLLNFNEIILIV